MASHDPQGPAAPDDPTESWAAAPTSELPAQASGQPAPGQPPQPAVTQAAPESAHPAYATVGAGPHGGPGGNLGAGGGGQAPGSSGYGPGGYGPGGYGPGGYGPGGYGPGGYGPGGYGAAGGPPGPPAGPPGAPPDGRPGFWRRATSTTGGIVALVVAGVLVVLLVLGLAGAAAFAVGRRVADHNEPRISQLREGPGNGAGPGQRGPKQRERQLVPPQGGMGGMGGNGRGLGSVLGGAAALGNVEHGEFTVTGADGKATVMTLQRGSVTAASSTALSVKSSDGFTATYTLDSTTRTPGRTLANGDTVLVLAQKSGSKAVLVRVTR